MRVFTDKWESGFLDEWCPPGWHRVAPVLWVSVAPVDNAFIAPGNDWRIIWNYAREIGLTNTYTKLMSRLHERVRNIRYLAWGYGRDLNARNDASAWGLFVAPFHPKCMERLVVPPSLFLPRAPAQVQQDSPLAAHTIRLIEAGKDVRGCLSDIAGWSPWSGLPVTPGIKNRLDTLCEHIAPLMSDDRRSLLLAAADGPITTAREPSHLRSAKPQAVLLGYGNYARTIILPRIKRYIDVHRVHEMDPLQVGPQGRRKSKWTWSTSPNAPEGFDYYLVASYHHFHAEHSLQGLKSGATVLCEKPVVTTWDQLESVIGGLSRTDGRFFACFHKRYSRYNTFAWQDLTDAQPGAPISYHAVVFEIPLPPKHWYRWPNSKSAIVSNGCHWIDHCLYLNDWSKPRNYKASLASDGSVMASFDMENGASFSIVLTHRGGRRVGLQNYVELRTEGRSARITNDSDYLAEDNRRIMRRASGNRLAAYGRMYQQLARIATSGHPGDSLESVSTSTTAMLELEERLCPP